MIGLRRGMIVVHWLVVLSTLSGINGKFFKYHFPWICCVLHGERDNAKLVGACTILDNSKVLVSVDNFIETVPGSSPPATFYSRIASGEIFVHAGSNYMNVELINSKPKYAQKRKAEKIFVAFNAPRDSGGGGWDIRMNPPTISPEAGASYGALGLYFNVGILEVTEEFTLNPFVHPMRLLDGDLETKIRDYLANLKKLTTQVDTCITYSWSQTQNRLRHHEVMFINKEDSCTEMFCQWKLSKCMDFPTASYLECFKVRMTTFALLPLNKYKNFQSTVFVDVCPLARGAALWCSKHNETVLAILTTAPSCGLRKMPGVYTTVPKIVEFFENAYKQKLEMSQRLNYELQVLDE